MYSADVGFYGTVYGNPVFLCTGCDFEMENGATCLVTNDDLLGSGEKPRERKSNTDSLGILSWY